MVFSLKISGGSFSRFRFLWDQGFKRRVSGFRIGWGGGRAVEGSEVAMFGV